MQFPLFCLLAFYCNIAYAVDSKCYTDSDLTAEVGTGFLTGQGAAAHLCDEKFPGMRLFAKHQQIAAKYQKQFVSFTDNLAGRFRRLYPDTWQGRYEQYMEERAKEVIRLVDTQLSSEFCSSLGDQLNSRIAQPWSSIEKEISDISDRLRHQVKLCGR